MNVLITGGSRGIGYKIAERFRQLGHIVICPTREECNLSNLNSVTEYLGNLKINVDILINNAGINKISKFDKISIDDINETNNVNFIAPLILSQHVIKNCFLKNGFGRIINIGTIWIKNPREYRTTYTLSKSALESLTKSISVEFGDRNILCNMISPGIVDTELTRQNNSSEELNLLTRNIKTGRFVKEEEVANLVLFLTLNNDNITGQNIFIDGGFKGSI